MNPRIVNNIFFEECSIIKGDINIYSLFGELNKFRKNILEHEEKERIGFIRLIDSGEIKQYYLNLYNKKFLSRKILMEIYNKLEEMNLSID